MTAFQAVCDSRSTKPDNRTNRVQTLKDNEDVIVLFFIHMSKWKGRLSCLSLVIKTLHKIRFLLGLFLTYAGGKMRSQDGTGSWRVQDQPPDLVFIGTAVIIPGRSKGNVSLPYFLNHHVGTIKKNQQVRSYALTSIIF